MGIWTSTPTYEQIRARNNWTAVLWVPLPAPPFPGAGRAQTASMVVLSDINRPLPGCLHAIRAHIGIKSLSWEHEGTLTQTELAIIVQIPLLGVSVLPAFGPKIASTATTGDINPFLFTRCFHLIFQYMYRSQNQSVGTFTFEIIELLCLVRLLE